jgi:hypothetical protein
MPTKSAAFCLLLAFLVSVSAFSAQGAASPQKPPAKSAAPASPNAQNMDAYIKLLRKDVRSQKSEVMSEGMQLDTDQAAKFWPIYRDYDAELSKVNDLRIANIKEYADSYNQMTDAKADELIHSAMAYQKQRAELLAKYYERMKQETGAVTAARFVQVEYQMLLIIDLQILSSLPVAGS